MYIEIQDATKIYEKPGGFRSSKESFTALDHISLQIEKGEFICLLGPSGCGKTTLMNSIAGFETLTEGSIIIDGQKVKHLPKICNNFSKLWPSPLANG